jgi:nitroreductase
MKDLKELIHYATLAPSGHNTQPWLFSLNDDTIEIRPDYKRRLPVVDPDDHALFISLGCALENLIIAANQFGYSEDIKYDLPKEKSEAIKVILTKSSEANENLLFDALNKRQSTRNKYDRKPLPESDILSLKEVTKQEGVIFKIFITDNEIEPLIKFVKEGNIFQFKNKEFVNELVSWIRFSKSDAEKKRDGIRSAVIGAPSIPNWFGKLIMKFNSGEKEAKKCEDAIRNSSGLVLFISEDNSKQNWINIGRSFERFALKATQLGLKHAHLNMPCEELEVRKKLQKYLGLPKEQQPLLLLRIGYSDPLPKSFRRNVEEVIT